jgi:hypothetical protein
LNSSFSKDASDTSWLSSLPQATSSPPPPPPLSPPRASSLIDTARGSAPESVVLPTSLRPSSDSGDKLLQDRCKALLKENADLTAEVIRLHDFEAGKDMLLRVYSLHLRDSAS